MKGGMVREPYLLLYATSIIRLSLTPYLSS